MKKQVGIIFVSYPNDRIAKLKYKYYSKKNG